LHRILKQINLEKMKKLALLLTIATFAITSCNEKPAEEAPVEAAVETTTETVTTVDSTVTAVVDTAVAATK
jgi:PBP1b-binding outer membrane lipoprotein LpoB